MANKTYTRIHEQSNMVIEGDDSHYGKDNVHEDKRLKKKFKKVSSSIIYVNGGREIKPTSYPTFLKLLNDRKHNRDNKAIAATPQFQYGSKDSNQSACPP